MNTKNKGKVGQILRIINIVPLLIFGLISVFLCNYYFTKTMQIEIEKELANIAYSLEALLDATYPGAYELVGESTFQLYKGETDITYAYGFVDNFKANTGLDVTVFYQDTRILSTLYDTSTGQRAVGTGAPQVVQDKVLKGGESVFYSPIIVNNIKYLAYYTPLHNPDGSIAGILFVGKPDGEVNAAIQRSLYPFLFITVIFIIVISIFLILYTNRIAHTLLHIRNFLADIATGNLTAELEPAVSDRHDEFGDIGRSAVSMQSSLRAMIEQDPLTGLSNRRAADRRLKQIAKKYDAQNTPFCIAIGDIDFFKKVNDTYGHDAGDLILKNVSDKLREHMRTYGFAARWGGEEFLLVFDHSNISEAHVVLENLMKSIRAMDSYYEDQVIKVTMTIGLIAGDTTDIDSLINRADGNLYEGKQGGRNRIIWQAPAIPEEIVMDASEIADLIPDKPAHLDN